MRKFIFVVGTTASGKSDLSLRFAHAFNLPIINADSVQVFQELSIGSAKPTKHEMSLAKHYLYDYISIKQKFTVADYLADVKNTLEKNNLSRAIFCGGSGFYLRALESGLYPETTVSEEGKLLAKKYLDENGNLKAWEYLKIRDSESAKKIHANDSYRLTRALEILFSQSQTPSEVLQNLDGESRGILKPDEVKKIGLFWSRESLRKRVQSRVEKMLMTGLIEEVKSLQSQGLDKMGPLQSVGYFEVLQYLRGEISLEQLPELITQGTMQLAKKQMTWFKRDKSIEWIEAGQEDSATEKLKSWLNS